MLRAAFSPDPYLEYPWKYAPLYGAKNSRNTTFKRPEEHPNKKAEPKLRGVL
jgi:hypothetical protein